MKRFIKKIALFALVFLTLAFVVDVLISRAVKEINEYPGEFEVWRDIEAGIECKLAVYGSSRAWVQYDSQILEDSTDLPTYNFGIDGQSFELQELRHQKLVANNPLPEVILLNVDVFSLIHKEELYQSQQFLPFMFWDFETYSYLKSYKGLDFEDFFVPCLRYMGREELLEKAFNGQTYPRYRNKGFQSKDEAWGFMVTDPSDTSKMSLPIDQSQAEMLRSFLSEMNDKKVQVILVWAPEHVLGQKRLVNRPEVVQHFEQLAQEFEIPFWNYSGTEMCKDKRYFYNATHMNTDGTIRFSSMLGKRLKSFLGQNSKRH